MDRIRAMRVFVRVAEEGSFAAAARVLGLSPAVATRAVAELEAHLGARLMNRTTRQLVLTDAGREFLERARRITAEVDEAEATVGADARAPAGIVRMLVPPDVSVHRLATQIPRFHAQFPMVTLRVDAFASATSGSEAYDITMLWTRGALHGESVARPLLRSEVVLCAAPSYLARHGRPRHPHELGVHDVMTADPGETHRTQLLRRAPEDPGHGAAREEAPIVAKRVPLSTTHVDVLYLAALAGLGIAGLPAYMVQDALEALALERVLPGWCLFSGTLWAVLPSRKYLPTRTRAVLEFLASAFGNGSEHALRSATRPLGTGQR